MISDAPAGGQDGRSYVAILSVLSCIQSISSVDRSSMWTDSTEKLSFWFDVQHSLLFCGVY